MFLISLTGLASQLKTLRMLLRPIFNGYSTLSAHSQRDNKIMGIPHS